MNNGVETEKTYIPAAPFNSVDSIKARISFGHIKSFGSLLICSCTNERMSESTMLSSKQTLNVAKSIKQSSISVSFLLVVMI